jgi:hypothetical protein
VRFARSLSTKLDPGPHMAWHSGPASRCEGRSYDGKGEDA